ncbi:dTDP-4-dehydrorhamnose reductase family protein [Tritonibacter scottomollicae]|uniref:dTDP-4-dehydrorhamnose reductase family protein n=1 Tax=Tritonibacter scottomollicae TaxID=483013 RepID=UPI003AA7DC81
MSGHRKPRILVLGATGMLGSMIFREMSADQSFETFGTVRASKAGGHFTPTQSAKIITNVGFDGDAGVVRAFSIARPEVVINCVGIIKQLPNASDHLESLAINAVLPHRLAALCKVAGARLIHFSTDCVFSGKSGNYVEDDFADASDLYGRTKYLGEVHYDNSVTLRTSIIGHELASAHSLIDWFLAQEGQIKGYCNAIFSGLPTVEIAQVLREFVLPNESLRGLYHLSVDPINKFDLLKLVAEVYGKEIEIRPDSEVEIDRSLDSSRFQRASGFTPKKWPVLIDEMCRKHRETAAGQA